MKPVKLFCLPFAGGNKYSYRDYELNAPPGLSIIPLEYPGRGSRIREKFITRMDALVDSMYDTIKDIVDNEDYALYGHSMGGIVAFFLARKLIANHHLSPLHLFVTGTTGPASTAVIEKKRYLMNKQDFIEEIRLLDGCPEEILQNEELLDYFEPILRADFEVSETYSYTTAEPLHIPFTVITGTEEDMKDEDILLWQQESVYEVDFGKMPGKHFFILNQSEKIIDIITKKIVNVIKAYQ